MVISINKISVSMSINGIVIFINVLGISLFINTLGISMSINKLGISTVTCDPLKTQMSQDWLTQLKMSKTTGTVKYVTKPSWVTTLYMWAGLTVHIHMAPTTTQPALTLLNEHPTPPLSTSQDKRWSMGRMGGVTMATVHLVIPHMFWILLGQWGTTTTQG